MPDSVQHKLNMIRQFYEGISDEELRTRLQKAGFEILDGVQGEVIFDELTQPDFVITANEAVEALRYQFTQSQQIFDLNHCMLEVA